MASDRQTEIQARVERAGAFADGDIEWLLAALSRAQQERDHLKTALEGSYYEAWQAMRAERDARTQEIATLRQRIGDVAERLAGLQEGDSRSPDWYHAASIAEEWVRALLQKGQ